MQREEQRNKTDRDAVKAMENGARGATLNHMEMRSYRAAEEEQAMGSHSREFCDVIIPVSIERAIFDGLEKTGLFNEGRDCIMKILPVEMSAAIHRRTG
jgi:hypothetical protein